MASTAPVESPSDSDLIYIRNPKLPDAAPARQSRAAFEAHFKAAGFVITDDAGQPTVKTGGAA